MRQGLSGRPFGASVPPWTWLHRHGGPGDGHETSLGLDAPGRERYGHVAVASDELLPLVDEAGRVIGSVPRSMAHGDPRMLHPVVHCHVLSPDGRLLLQLRSATKDVQPGKWDTSVGGHVAFGESIELALERELGEELGLDARALSPRPLYRYVNRTAIESELVHSFLCEATGPFRIQRGEIDEARFWSHGDIVQAVGSETFTPNFEEEYARLCRALGRARGH